MANPIAPGKAVRRRCGFTLIELLVVLAIIALLATISYPKYFHTIDTATDTALHQTLKNVRETIDKYYGDTGKYPDSLQDLVNHKYLRALPYDPVVESDSTWIIVPPEDSNLGGVYDVRSSASGSGSDGTVYAEY
jgi:general secretion pathway protein G